MFEFKLPDLGEGVHEGEVLQWYVKAGDAIREDDPLVEVETDKAAVTIPSPRSGTVVSLHGEVGQIVHTGDVIAVIDESGAAAKKATQAATEKTEPSRVHAGSGSGPEEKAATPPERDRSLTVAAPTSHASSEPQAIARGHAQPGAAVPHAVSQTPPEGRKGPVPAAPATRRLARELGVDLGLVPASGPAGRVTPEDVRAYAQSPGAATSAGARAAAMSEPSREDAGTARGLDVVEGATALPFVVVESLPDFGVFGPVEKEALRSVRRKIAVRMATSMTLIPHVAHIDDADVTELEEFRLRWRERMKDQPGGRLTLLAFVVKAAVSALRRFPGFNASLDPVRQEIVYKKYYNIGIAADSPKGLVVPVVRGADGKSVLEVAEAVVDVASRAKAEKLSAQDFQGGTFTITNIGPIGGKLATPVINYPESAILAMFRVEERPVVRNGQIVVRKIMPLVLGFDHRVVDGADAARFTTHVVELLQDPPRLLLET